jgi:hypothetical protein
VHRRHILAAAGVSAFLSQLLRPPAAAAVIGGGGPNSAVTAGLQRYVRKKKLDAIDSYLAPLLNARDQLVRIGRVMMKDPAGARKQLRSGAFAGVRDSVRAMGEFAAREQGQEAGAALVSGFLGGLEALDQQLLLAARGDVAAGEAAQAKLAACSAAPEALLAAAPEEAMAQARRVVEGAQRGVDAEGGEGSGAAADPAELARLQQLL